MFLYTDTVKKKQFIQKNKDSLLHFLHTLLIIDRISFLSMSYCIPQEQIPRQLMIEIGLQHGQVAQISHPAHSRIPKPCKQQKNISIPNLIISKERMYILDKIIDTYISRYPF